MSNAISLRVLAGLAYAFRFDAKGIAEKLSVEKPQPEYRDGWVWLHFDLQHPGTSQSVAAISELPAAAKALLVGATDHQQIYAANTCAYGVFASLFEDSQGAAKEIGFVQFAMTERLFISSCRQSLAAKDLTGDDYQNWHEISGPVVLLEMIFEHVLDGVDEYANDLANNLDDIEEKMLLDESDDNRDLLSHIRRAAVRLQRQVAVGHSLVQRIERQDAGDAKLTLRFAAERLGQRLDWLGSEIGALRERAHLLQEEAMLKTADQTNTRLQVLAIVATVFLPATFIAGIFGMNVKGLPLTQTVDGFLWSMVLLIGASALVFWLLKRSGMLG